MSRRRLSSYVAIALVAVVLGGIAAFGGDAQAGRMDTKLTLVAYSTPREAYAKLIPAFAETQAGHDTSFDQSYGASGEQARAVIAGLKADVVALSLEPDMTSLVKAGLVARNWKQDGYERHRHSLRRRLRGAQGQPEEDPHVGRPDQARR